MTIDLTDTSTGAIHEALTQARRRMGGPASGTVLTLIIVTDESAQYDAVRAASQAGREHPSRVLAVITRKPKGPTGRGDLVARRSTALARRGSARRGRPAPGDGRGSQRDAQGHAADPGQGLPAG